MGAELTGADVKGRSGPEAVIEEQKRDGFVLQSVTRKRAPPGRLSWPWRRRSSPAIQGATNRRYLKSVSSQLFRRPARQIPLLTVMGKTRSPRC